jgi:outer membrane protein assembly factor BamB
VKPQWTFTPAGKPVATAPVSAGGMTFVAGSDGAVRALDAASGKPQWTAYTGGMIKYPPVVSQGRVYVGSGDGHVYCLEAATGKSLWKFRAAPAHRLIPVFGSLLSTWPVGSGVLVDKGVVYAAAGNANFDGTHVYALDAITGKIVWQNNTSGHLLDEDSSGAGVQGHLLLHGKKLYLAGGNHTGVVSYDLASGSCKKVGQGVGKDLYLLADQVHASGLPLYFRPEDSHLIERAGFVTPAGLVAIYQDRVGLADPTGDPKGKLQAIWTAKPFEENNAVAVTKNAVLVAGIDRKETPDGYQITAGLCALNLKDGKVLWQHLLPGEPCAWGIAIDKNGGILVSMQDGRVMCFAAQK